MRLAVAKAVEKAAAEDKVAALLKALEQEAVRMAAKVKAARLSAVDARKRSDAKLAVAKARRSAEREWHDSGWERGMSPLLILFRLGAARAAARSGAGDECSGWWLCVVPLLAASRRLAFALVTKLEKKKKKKMC